MKKITAVLAVLIILACKSFGTELTDITVIENDIFGFEYEDESIAKRLSRLEKHIFGQEKKGTNEARIKNIADASGISFKPKQTAEEKRIAAADYNPEDKSVSYPVIDMMEEKEFNKHFQGENVYKRIERLEKKVFGKTFDGNLSDRTDKLKASILAVKPQKTAENQQSYKTTYYEDDDNYFSPSNSAFIKKSQNSYPTGMAAPLNSSYYNSYGNNTSDFEFALSAAENMILGKTNEHITAAERLEKLEKKIFKKTYSGDHLSRLDRIVTAAQAQKSGKIYQDNKWDKYITTGIQVGTILLMILAMVL